MNCHIETERLLLRPIRLNDSTFILKLLNSKGWLEFIGDRKVRTESAAKAYLQKVIESRNTFYTLFEIKGTQTPVGIISFLERAEEDFPDLGFALLPKFEGKGYTVEAAGSYLQEIKRNNKFENIIAKTLSRNKRSIAVIRKLGLNYAFDKVKDGELISYYSLKALDQLGSK